MYKLSDRNKEIVDMYNSGARNKDIAEKYGLSCQRVYSIIYQSEYQKNNGKWLEQIERIIYPNIKRYMIENRMPIYVLNEYINPDTKSAVVLSRFLTVENVKVDIRTINRILEVTGMTFEEAFYPNLID